MESKDDSEISENLNLQNKQNKQILENNKILRYIESVRLNMDKILKDQFNEQNQDKDQNKNIQVELLNDIDILKSTIQVQEKHIEQILQKNQEYVVQINRIIDKEHDQGLKKTIKRLLHLEKINSHTEQQTQEFIQKINIISKENSVLQQENNQLQKIQQIDRFKYLSEEIKITTQFENKEKSPEILFEKYMRNFEQELANCRLKLYETSEELIDLKEDHQKQSQELEIVLQKVQELTDISNSQLQKIKQFESLNIKDLQQQLKQYMDENQKLQKIIHENGIQIDNLKIQVSTQKNEKMQELVDSAIQELSLIILSKDVKSNILNENTKLIVKQIFGDDFSNIVNNYEEGILDLRKQIQSKDTQIQQFNYKFTRFCQSSQNIANIIIKTIKYLDANKNKPNLNMNVVLGKIYLKLTNYLQNIKKFKEQLIKEQQYIQDEKFKEKILVQIDNNNNDNNNNYLQQQHQKQQQQQQLFNDEENNQNNNNYNNNQQTNNKFQQNLIILEEISEYEEDLEEEFLFNKKISLKQQQLYVEQQQDESFNSVETPQKISVIPQQSPQQLENQIYEKINNDQQLKELQISNLEFENKNLKENLQEMSLKLEKVRQQYDVQLEKQLETQQEQTQEQLCLNLMQAISLEELLNLQQSLQSNSELNNEQQQNLNPEQKMQNKYQVNNAITEESEEEDLYRSSQKKQQNQQFENIVAQKRESITSILPVQTNSIEIQEEQIVHKEKSNQENKKNENQQQNKQIIDLEQINMQNNNNNQILEIQQNVNQNTEKQSSLKQQIQQKLQLQQQQQQQQQLQQQNTYESDITQNKQKQDLKQVEQNQYQEYLNNNNISYQNQSLSNQKNSDQKEQSLKDINQSYQQNQSFENNKININNSQNLVQFQQYQQQQQQQQIQSQEEEEKQSAKNEDFQKQKILNDLKLRSSIERINQQMNLLNLKNQYQEQQQYKLQQELEQQDQKQLYEQDQEQFRFSDFKEQLQNDLENDQIEQGGMQSNDNNDSCEDYQDENEQENSFDSLDLEIQKKNIEKMQK